MDKLFITMSLFYILSGMFMILSSFIGTIIPLIFVICGSTYVLFVAYNELINTQNNSEIPTGNDSFLFIE